MLSRTESIAHIGSWEWEIATDAVIWSEELFRIFKLDPSQGAPSWAEQPKLYHPEDFKALRKAVELSVANGTPYELNLRALRTDGKIRVCKATGFVELDSNKKPVRLVGSLHDITKRSNTEKELRESEKRYRNIFDNEHVSILVIDPETGSIVDANPSATSFYGWSNSELIKMNIKELNTLPWDDISSAMQKIKNERGKLFHFQHRLKDGSIRDVEIASAPVEYYGKTRLFSIVHDITEQKKIEKLLIKDESLLQGLYDNMTSGSAIYQVINDGSKGSDFIVKRFNQKSLEIEGKTLEQVVGMRLSDLRPNIDDYGLIPVMKRVWETGEPAYFPVKMYHDKKFSNYYENYIFKIPTGEVVTIYNDVTDQKNRETALRENEERYALAMEFTNDGLFDWNLVTNEIYYSSGWKRLLGYQDNELPNDFSIWETLTKPEDVKRSWEMQQELIDKQRDRFEIEFKMKHKNGHWIDILSRAKAVFDDSGKATRIVGTHIDITDRKIAEMQLYEKEKALRLSLDAAKAGTWTWDIRTGKVIWDDRMHMIFGIEPGTFNGTFDAWKSRVHPDDIKAAEKATRLALEQNQRYDHEYRVKGLSGEWRTINAQAAVLNDSLGDPVRMSGFAMDITDRKNAENELLQQKKFLQKAQQIGKIGTWELDIQKNELQWTDENYKIFGIPIGSKLTYEKFLDCVHPDDRNYVDTEWKASFSGKPYDIVHRLISDGKTKWVREKAELEFNEKGECIKGTGFTQDITELKQAENSSKRLMTQLESLWNIAKIADSEIKNISNHVLIEAQKMTQSQYAFYGGISENEQKMVLHAWSHETMGDCEIDEKTLHFDIQKAGIWAEAVRNRKILTINDFTIENQESKGMPDGHAPLTRLMVVPLVKNQKVISIVAVGNKKYDYSKDDEQQLEAFLGNVQILIDRKKAEKALIESEKKWRNILVTTPQIGISLNPQGKIVFANEHFLKITGWKKENVINQNWFDLFIPDFSFDNLKLTH